MRSVYIDEAGISNLSHEPHLVVAAVIVNADTQWKELERYYYSMAQELFPEEDAYRFVFHAHEVWHGTKNFNREKWTKPERLNILRRLAQVPVLFNLRVALGVVDRATVNKMVRKHYPKAKPELLQHIAHANAFVEAIKDVDYELSKNAPDEVAMLFAEDTPKMKGLLRYLHNAYSGIDQETEFEPDDFRTERIVDTVHFAQKNQSMLLQVADHCAFIAKRKSMECDTIGPFFEQIRGALISGAPIRNVKFKKWDS